MGPFVECGVVSLKRTLDCFLGHVAPGGLIALRCEIVSDYLLICLTLESCVASA